MEVPLLDNILWSINQPYMEAKIITEQGDVRPITNQEWQQVILPGRNFTIVYPFAGYHELDQTIPYDAEGQPVTLLDLLATIYEFYQEPIPQGELTQLIKEEPAIYKANFNKRLAAMIRKVNLESLDRLGKDLYGLNLRS